MELRLGEPAKGGLSDWDVSDIAEYNGIKQIAIMMAIAPLIAVLSALGLFVTPGSFPNLGIATFTTSFILLMCIGTLSAGIVSRHWQIRAVTVAAHTAVTTFPRRAKARADQIHRIVLGGNCFVRHHIAYRRALPVRTRVALEDPAPLAAHARARRVFHREELLHVSRITGINRHQGVAGWG